MMDAREGHELVGHPPPPAKQTQGEAEKEASAAGGQSATGGKSAVNFSPMRDPSQDCSVLGSSCLAPSRSNPVISLSYVEEDRCIVLDNLFDGIVEREKKFYYGIRNHLLRNSACCGPVNHMHVDKKCGRVYMLFDSARTANKAAEKWHQSLYQGNVITVSFSDTTEYKTKHGAEA